MAKAFSFLVPYKSNIKRVKKFGKLFFIMTWPINNNKRGKIEEILIFLPGSRNTHRI